MLEIKTENPGLDEIRSIPMVDILEKLNIDVSKKKILCLWHNDEHPSCHVYDTSVFCYVCGEHGDGIDVWRKVRGTDFPTTIAQIGEAFGINVTINSKDIRQKAIDNTLSSVSEIYRKALWSGDNPALRYLRDRGLTDETIKAFGLGWGGFKSHLDRSGLDIEICLEAGLVAKSKTDDGVFDLLRGRVIIPTIWNGRVVGMSGRAIGKATGAKYINTRTKISYPFSAPDYLSSKNNETVVLVEGQMDCMSARQMGIVAVGPQGTNGFKPEMLRFLNADSIEIAFDPDGAGIEASLKVGRMLSDLGAKVRIVEMPVLGFNDGKPAGDMNEYMLQGYKKEDFLSLPRWTIDQWEIKLMLKDRASDSVTRMDLAKKLWPVIKNLSGPEREVVAPMIAKTVGIREEAIKAMWRPMTYLPFEQDWAVVVRSEDSFDTLRWIGIKNVILYELGGLMPENVKRTVFFVGPDDFTENDVQAIVQSGDLETIEKIGVLKIGGDLRDGVDLGLSAKDIKDRIRNETVTIKEAKKEIKEAATSDLDL